MWTEKEQGPPCRVSWLLRCLALTLGKMGALGEFGPEEEHGSIRDQ